MSKNLSTFLRNGNNTAPLPVSVGGTGVTTLTGLVKGAGAVALTAAVAGTDYLAPPTGTSLLKANSGGALANAVAGTDYQAPIGTISGLVKGNGANLLTAATAGTDYQAPIGTISGLVKGNGANALTAAVAGTDYMSAQSVTGIVKSSGTTRSAAVAGTDYVAPTGSITGTAGGLSSTLAITSGGTGATSASAALTALGAYAANNPSGYTTNTGTVTSISGTGTVNGLTLTGTVTSSGSLTLGGSLSGSLASCTVDGTYAIGFREIPQNSQSAAYTTVLSDNGKHILHPSADTTARTFTIDNSLAYPIGTSIVFINQNSAGSLTISISTGTMRLAGAGTTGNRTLAANGMASALKIASTEWIISGTNLT